MAPAEQQTILPVRARNPDATLEAKDISGALAALTVVVNRQTDGDAYVPVN
jgi:hypothetical protein